MPYVRPSFKVVPPTPDAELDDLSTITLLATFFLLILEVIVDFLKVAMTMVAGSFDH